MLLEAGDELFEILHGDTAGGTATSQTRKVRRVQAEFGHASFHAGRDIAGAGSVCGHGQAANGRLNSLRAAVRILGAGAVRMDRCLVFCWSRWRIETEPGGVFLARLEMTEHRADGITFVQLNQEFLDCARAGSSDIHRGFVCFDLNNVLIRADGVADGDEQVDNRCFGDGLAELRHDDRDGGHVRKCASENGCGKTTDHDYGSPTGNIPQSRDYQPAPVREVGS
jgi:hypothetical protein